jgi:hypothetical protein
MEKNEEFCATFSQDTVTRTEPKKEARFTETMQVRFQGVKYPIRKELLVGLGK